MKRVLALALVGGALLLGGCDRQRVAAPPAGGDRPAATESPAATHSPAATGRPAAATATAGNGSSDVDSLLGDVDKQLSSDDQTPADQD